MPGGKAPPEPWVREYYAKFAPERAASFNIKNLGNPVLFGAIVPEVFCPNLVRVGTVLDGGKYVCNPRLIPENCSIYSLGIDNEISFDKAIQEFNNFTCKIYGYDKATTNNVTLSEYEKINGKIEKLELASKTNASANEYFLGDLVQRNNDTFVEILKMDVEGQEHDSLVPFLQKYDVCQVLVEIHGTAESHVSLLRSIAK
ncbi:hypothetical protein TELCIR_08032 [Teladorsagia circumcincta]|uniref:Methyltransferase domain-containing protein n=1 Tax=Teladorsagia circumcincta TaxID=45464 RepID=A0A2G9UJ04_TELCI|nr:hypothetical protein TELCIR_08032 [Teladorsagia circumcincta]